MCMDRLALCGVGFGLGGKRGIIRNRTWGSVHNLNKERTLL